MRPINLTGLSKTISHALRHAPGEYGLTLDAEGWVAIDDLLRGLKNRRWDVEEVHLHQMIEQAEKKRFQIADGRIRAYYGHSTETKIVKEPQVPPTLLYHGTVMSSYNNIMQHGLKPMERQYVHLSADVPTAKMVAGRRPGPHVIFTVDARAAYDAGVQFYGEENGIWLADEVPARYIRERFLTDKYVLVRSEKVGYSVISKDGVFCILEDVDVARMIIDDLISQGAEIFDDVLELAVKYPPITSEERKVQSQKFASE